MTTQRAEREGVVPLRRPGGRTPMSFPAIALVARFADSTTLESTAHEDTGGRMVICGQAKCSELASWSYVWPGHAERKVTCPECFLKAQSISAAMGFVLGDARPMTMDEMIAETNDADS